MFVRVAVICLALAPFVASAAEKTEYLVPEDGGSQSGSASNESYIDLTPKAFASGLSKHLKEIPQCVSGKLGKGELIKDGKVVYQILKLGSASVDIILDLNSKGKIANAKFTGPQGAKNDAQVQAMMCSTYAVMRTLQPDYETPEQASGNMAHVWKSAANKPFKMAFYFNSIKTQYVPFEMNVF